MKFTPKTEEEIVTENLLPKGKYDFEIAEAKDDVSKKGNEMIVLKVKVFDSEGNSYIVFDYLLEEIAAKLRGAAVACGILNKYESGELVALDFEGKAGQVQIGIQKDKTNQYPDKNTIYEYIASNNDEPVDLEIDNDEVPF